MKKFVAICDDLLEVVGAHKEGEFMVAGAPTGPASDRLRLANRRHLVRIASRDVSADDPTEIIEDGATAWLTVLSLRPWP